VADPSPGTYANQYYFSDGGATGLSPAPGDTYAAFFHETALSDLVEQTIGGFISGDSYTIDFSMAASQGGEMKVGFGSATELFDFSTADSNWQSYSITAVANSSSLTISFTGSGSGGEVGIDDVRVAPQSTPSSVPDSGSALGLLVPALLGLVTLGKRRSRPDTAR